MTPGHRHRTVRLPRPVVWLLTRPVDRTASRSHVEASRWTWRREDVGWPAPDGRPEFPPVYVLTPLGILHTLTGLTIHTEDHR